MCVKIREISAITATNIIAWLCCLPKKNENSDDKQIGIFE